MNKEINIDTMNEEVNTIKCLLEEYKNLELQINNNYTLLGESKQEIVNILKKDIYDKGIHLRYSLQNSNIPENEQKIIINNASNELYKLLGDNFGFTGPNDIINITNKKLLCKQIENNYISTDKSIYYINGLNDIIKIDGADPETFLKKGDYGIDKNCVYCMGVQIEGADPKTFKNFGKCYSYAVDKNNAYYGGKKINNIDIKKIIFNKNEPDYIKDKNTVFYKGNHIEGADSNSFHALYNDNGIITDYGIDNNSVYFEGIKFEGADPKSFKKVCRYNYAKDNNNFYYEGKIVEGADPKTIQSTNDPHIYTDHTGSIYIYGLKMLGSDYGTLKNIGVLHFKDKNNVYFIDNINNIIIQGADPKTFKHIEYKYGKDINSVYFGSCKIEGSDPKTFKHTKSDRLYSQDKNGVYYKGMKINEADPQTFKYVYNIGGKDNNTVFYKGKKIEGADPHSWKGKCDSYGYDTNTVFYKGKKIEGADPKTFTRIDYRYGKDNNSVYYKGKKIEGADPKTFKHKKGSDYFLYVDHQSVYYKSKQIKGISSKGLSIINYYDEDDELPNSFRKNNNFFGYKNTIIGYFQ